MQVKGEALVAVVGFSLTVIGLRAWLSIIFLVSNAF